MTLSDYTKSYTQKEKDLLYYLYPDSGFTFTDTYCTYDAIHTGKGHVTEVKQRKFSYEFFQTQYKGEMLIELDKYKALVKKASETGFKPVYVFGFTDYHTQGLQGYLALNLQNLDLSSLPTQLRLCPMDSNPSNTVYIEKECYIIPNGFIPESNRHLKLKN